MASVRWAATGAARRWWAAAAAGRFLPQLASDRAALERRRELVAVNDRIAMAEAEATADLQYRRNSVADLLAQAAATFSLDEPQATLQAATGGAITYGSEDSSNRNPHAFHDRNGFEGYALQFAEECKGMSELEAIETVSYTHLRAHETDS